MIKASGAKLLTFSAHVNPETRLPLDSFNDWGGGCKKFGPVLGGDDTEIAPTGDIFDQPLDGMS